MNSRDRTPILHRQKEPQQGRGACECCADINAKTADIQPHVHPAGVTAKQGVRHTVVQLSAGNKACNRAVVCSRKLQHHIEAQGAVLFLEDTSAHKTPRTAHFHTIHILTAMTAVVCLSGSTSRPCTHAGLSTAMHGSRDCHQQSS
jgi:hypothetical protein